MRLYRRVAKQDEVCAYGDTHHVGIYEVVEVTVVSEAVQPDVSGYDQGSGPSLWAADSEGRIYYRPFNAMDSGGWARDDGITFWSRIYTSYARDLEGRPLTDRTPEMTMEMEHTDG